jgi:hypothetical protein
MVHISQALDQFHTLACMSSLNLVSSFLEFLADHSMRSFVNCVSVVFMISSYFTYV